MTELETKLTGALEWLVLAPNPNSIKNAKEVLDLARRMIESKPQTLTSEELDMVGGGTFEGSTG